MLKAVSQGSDVGYRSALPHVVTGCSCGCLAAAQNIVPLVKNAHYLLVTLLLCNAAAMEVRCAVQALVKLSCNLLFSKLPPTPWLPAQTLPLFLNKLVHEGVAIIISVTAVLLFGELMGVGTAQGTVSIMHSQQRLSGNAGQTHQHSCTCVWHHARRRDHSAGSVLQIWSADRVSHGLACACTHAYHVAHLLACVQGEAQACTPTQSACKCTQEGICTC